MRNQVLNLASLQDPYTLDPQRCGDRISSTVIFMLYKGLTRMEADRKVSVDLADSYQISNGSKTYTFHLGNHLWSDGSQITAEDFVRSWKRALDPNFYCPFYHFFIPIKNAEKIKKGILSLDSLGVNALSYKVLEVELESPCPYFLELTSFYTLFPIPNEDSLGKVWSGSMVLEKWEVKNKLILKKNKNSKNFFPVRLDQVNFHIVKSQMQALELFEQGKVDWLGDPISPLPLNPLSSLLKEKKVRPITGVVACWFNVEKKAFQNSFLRKALYHSIDRKLITGKLSLPHLFCANRHILDVLLGPESDSFALSLKEILQLFEKGMKSFNLKTLELSLAYEMTEEHSRLAELLKASWEKLFPIEIILVPLPLKKFFEMLPKHQFDITIFCAISPFMDPINFLEGLEKKTLPKNLSRWESRPYQKLLSQYRKEEDPSKRAAIARKAELILLKEAPIAPLYSYYYSYLQKPFVKNFSISPNAVMQFDRVFLSKK